ncbi:MAG: hypothetical protein K2J95_01150 [Lachnospiraceae bacterium]|nr:hypothetical protein [Lachnospiraceae bacterium]
MAHRSGGGSHSGGHHSGGGHHSSGGRGGSNGPHYSNRPFRNSRRFRYYDRHGRERYLYGSEMPKKMGIFSLIVSILPLIPFILVGIFTLVYPLSSLRPPKPLSPVYEPTDVHIMDTIGVIDDKESLEKVLQEFEDTTGISPYIKTVYYDEWIWHYDEFWDYAYSEYLNTFDDEQHFLIVYTEPENAEELDFVDWFWEGIQGDDTDPILTESKVDRFGEDLQDNFLRNNISVGKAFEYTFEESLTYMMGRNDNDDALSILFFGVVWNAFVLIFVVGVINSFIISRRDYQEVPMEGSSNTVPGTMGYGNGTAYQSGMGASYQSNTTFQNDPNYGNSQIYQSGQVYQSGTNITKQYMYYDKNGNKNFVSSPTEDKVSALVKMIIILVILVPMLFTCAPILLVAIMSFINPTTDVNVKSSMMPMAIGSGIWCLVVIGGIVTAIRHYIIVRKRQYVEVTNDNYNNYGNSMPNNNAAQYNVGMQSNTMQYGAGTQYNTAQYGAGTQNNVAGDDYYNDDARFRGPEYYDDDARYHGSTAYEAGKK